MIQDELGFISSRSQHMTRTHHSFGDGTVPVLFDTARSCCQMFPVFLYEWNNILQGINHSILINNATFPCDQRALYMMAAAVCNISSPLNHEPLFGNTVHSHITQKAHDSFMGVGKALISPCLWRNTSAVHSVAVDLPQ